MICGGKNAAITGTKTVTSGTICFGCEVSCAAKSCNAQQSKPGSEAANPVVFSSSDFSDSCTAQQSISQAPDTFASSPATQEARQFNPPHHNVQKTKAVTLSEFQIVCLLTFIVNRLLFNANSVKFYFIIAGNSTR